MRNKLDERAREELATLQKRADLNAIEARRQLPTGLDVTYGNMPEATVLALLAIEARLAMATSFLLWALESDDESD